MIRNLTKGTIITRNHKLCSSPFSKFLGLMFSRPRCLVFPFRKQRISLHMLFVFYPIDVLFLDDKLRVVELKEGFRPFTFYTSRKEASYVVELPEGSIRKTRTVVGDKIGF